MWTTRNETELGINRVKVTGSRKSRWGVRQDDKRFLISASVKDNSIHKVNRVTNPSLMTAMGEKKVKQTHLQKTYETLIKRRKELSTSQLKDLIHTMKVELNGRFSNKKDRHPMDFM